MSIQENDRTPRHVSGLGDVLARLIEQVQARPVDSLRGDNSPSSGNTDANVRRETVMPQYRLAPPGGDENRQSVFIRTQEAVNAATGGVGRLFLSPIISGVLRLFRQQSEPLPEPLQRFSPAVGRLLERTASTDANGEAVGIRRDAYGTAVSAGTGPMPVQISIQALDARSILERSSDIAQAVRQAMLSNHEITNDMGEL